MDEKKRAYYRAYEKTPKRREWKRAYDRKRAKLPHRIAYREANWRRWELLSRYGISLNTYETLKREQHHKCKICHSQLVEGKKFGNLRVDHNHTTKQVRGLLCQRCNILVGFLETCSSLIPVAQAYLSKAHSEANQRVHPG